MAPALMNCMVELGLAVRSNSKLSKNCFLRTQEAMTEAQGRPVHYAYGQGTVAMARRAMSLKTDLVLNARFTVHMLGFNSFCMYSLALADLTSLQISKKQ